MRFQRALLVTGGAGFIGCNFVRHALARGVARVVVLDKLTYAGSAKNLEGLDPARVRCVQGDICDRGLVDALLREHAPEAIVHLAAESHVDRSIDGPAAFVHSNLVGTFTLLEAARARQAEGQPLRFHHVSTDEVFGSLGAEGAFHEDSPYAPNSPYSATKAGSDHLVRSYGVTFGLDVVTTNCSNNYGPWQFPEKLVPLMIRRALAGQPLPVYGRGDNVRDWLHVEDHCAALFAVLQRAEPGSRYNVGGGVELSNLEMVHRLTALLDELRPATRPRRELIEFVQDRPGHDRRYAIDGRKLQRELGVTPRHSLEEGLRQTVQWYLEHEEYLQQRDDAGVRLGLGARAEASGV